MGKGNVNNEHDSDDNEKPKDDDDNDEYPKEEEEPKKEDNVSNNNEGPGEEEETKELEVPQEEESRSWRSVRSKTIALSYRCCSSCLKYGVVVPGFILAISPGGLCRRSTASGAQAGFLSIDCGLDANYSGYKDPNTGIFYVSDGPYVDTGENHMVAAQYQGWRNRHLQTLRSFPSGVRNCYTLPTKAGAKYIARMDFFYGDYDGKNSSSVDFDLHLGPNYWVTAYSGYVYEALFVAWASSVPVCLVNTGHGTPFVSVVELRPLDALYPPVTPGFSMSLYTRQNMGPNASYTRYPDDTYDRYWWPVVTDPRWVNLSTTGPIQPDPSFIQPSLILQTAVTAAGNDTTLTVLWQENRKSYSVMVFLHFADFQNTQLRQFDIYLNGDRLGASDKPHSPSSVVASCVYSSGMYRSPDGSYNITLAATASSVLPPMLNALEIYTVITHDSPTTFPKDFDAIMVIKLEYGVKKNWIGDPCFPTKYAWDGVKCSNTSDNVVRITSIDLSNSNLHGAISKKFTLLTALENLDLSYNNLNGSIPDSLLSLPSLHVLNLSGNHLSGESLCKNYTGLVFSYDSDGYMCNKPPPSPPRNKVAIIAISVVVPVLAVVVFPLAYFIWREKRKPIVQPNFPHGPARDPQLENALGSRKLHADHLRNTYNRWFTYKELQKFTNNFKQFIGQGGFGPVYYGCLEDDTEVAVKMCSESSSHGLDEFLAEVQSLTKVHHRNLVSLIGYCWEKDHLALVYEYMSQGSLFDHLRGKNGVAETLNWGTRVRVLFEAAQGLDYLHKGCNLPIIHRDVKTSNILLGHNLQAKIADFGLSKTYLSDTQTHISATAAGTTGYMDPEYYQTGRITESSDVYSFGVVLLEVVTGEPPMVPGHGLIVQRVKQKIDTGDICSFADAWLGGAYNVSSMWKVVETAMMCTADSAAQRPTMAAVVVQLKESLALEEAREKESSARANPGSHLAGSVFTFSQLAR
ncbi:probable LRR receptor-like serine/threonine-protein kinase At1g51810 [Phragmites australis]|uniref:probable LRR receptor-like serine/threonine-protein kinase At1g51810 n=1 Tax=Phragmites australis TaxID=29695 RepID=UPI002D7A1954|nr:probable LRR receptor-like serine/threonine-protein kinase At1g51810 [Phragmites australis]